MHYSGPNSLEEALDDDRDVLLSKESGISDEEALQSSLQYSSRLDTIIILSLITTLLLITVAIFRVLYSQTYSNLAFSQDSCQNPALRREWRSLNPEEQEQYLTAVKCLTQNPSRLGLPTTRYDDFVYVHIKLYDGAHNVAPSLPWHRYFIYVFEKTLRSECGYNNYLPYWDWTLDSAQPEHSPIWSPQIGFGGNGDASSHCVQDGYFLDISPQYPSQHCLRRNFTAGMNGFNYTADIISELIQNANTYEEFRSRLESGPHKSVHNGIGGEMPTDASPNDPIFYVHHAQIDRLWWNWQRKRPDERFREYFGPLTIENGSKPEAFSASLQDTIQMLGLAEDRTASDVMTIESGLFCYTYIR